MSHLLTRTFVAAALIVFAAVATADDAKPNRIERGVQKVEKGAKRTVERTGNWAERTADRTKKGIERTADRTEKKIKKILE